MRVFSRMRRQVHPGIDALLLTPLNSTTLASRPLLLPGSSLIRLHVRSESVFLEGKYGKIVHPGEMVAVRKSEWPLPCFTRDNATSDFVYDLNHRIMYQVRCGSRHLS
jgi:NAD kinase